VRFTTHLIFAGRCEEAFRFYGVVVDRFDVPWEVTCG
jgi:hypothetical protein